MKNLKKSKKKKTGKKKKLKTVSAMEHMDNFSTDFSIMIQLSAAFRYTFNQYDDVQANNNESFLSQDNTKAQVESLNVIKQKLAKVRVLLLMEVDSFLETKDPLSWSTKLTFSSFESLMNFDWLLNYTVIQHFRSNT